MKVPRASFLIPFLALIYGIPVASEKPDRKAFLESKVPEVANRCHDLIIATSKDPDSVKFLGDYRYTFGSGLLVKNSIFVDWEIMGRNSYGAVLRHTMECEYSCKKGKECKAEGLQDYPA